MKKGSKEYEYWKDNPSPLAGLMIWCRTAHCKLVLPFHGTAWRKSTEEDERWYRENNDLRGFCPTHWAMVQALKEQQEGDA